MACKPPLYIKKFQFPTGIRVISTIEFFCIRKWYGSGNHAWFQFPTGIRVISTEICPVSILCMIEFQFPTGIRVISTFYLIAYPPLWTVMFQFPTGIRVISTIDLFYTA